MPKLVPSIVQKNSIDDKKSFLSGATGILALHHTMNGPFRSKATKYGLWIWLTPAEHEWIHLNSDKMRALKAYSQICFEDKYNHEKWMYEFKKDYLNDSKIDRKLFTQICKRERQYRINI